MKRFWKYVTGIVPAYGLFPLVFSFVFNIHSNDRLYVRYVSQYRK